MDRVPRRRGIALILALLVLTLLVVVIGQLAYTTRIDLQIARNAADAQEGLHACWGGLEFAKALLRDDVARNDHDGLADRWARLTKPIAIGPVSVELRIEDEDRKLNLLLVRSENETYRTWAEGVVRRLVALARDGDTTEGAVPADQLAENLIGWLEEGKTPGVGSDDQAFTEEGGTDEIPPLTLAEFLAVEGWTPEVLYGPAALPAPIADDDDPHALPADAAAAPDSLDELLGKAPKQVRGLAPFFTLWTGGRVNVNTADPLLLKAMSEHVDDATVEAIVNARRPGGAEAEPNAASGPLPTEALADTAFTDTGQVREIEGMDDGGEGSAWSEMGPFLGVQSQVFKITATATVRRVRRSVEMVVRREAEGFTVLWYKER